MSHQEYVKAGICEKYQTLLEECGRALATWDEYRAKAVQSGPIGKEAGDEIFRLQVKYARANAMLQNHLRDCLVCRLIARFGSSQDSDATTLYGASHH
jgi:hypothetical protein